MVSDLYKHLGTLTHDITVDGVDAQILRVKFLRCNTSDQVQVKCSSYREENSM